MNDFYSIFRFALPGISSITEFIILFSLSMNWKSVLQITQDKNSNLPSTLEIALFTFFTIGIGFIYNLIYRTMPCMRIDYSAFANKLKNDKLISIDFKDFATGQSVLDKITKENAWGIFNTLWHSRSGNSPLIKEATERSEKFAHLLRNSGTSLIGFATALMVYYLVVLNFYEYFDRCRLFLFFYISGLSFGERPH
ncbi:hypothetical protein [Leptospira stimsonii]|uniref:Uncharacterized protein n=1 Tax=Leptospira stimsonii TaxID=2202203 RepID=A0A396YLQ2_9LEPT|nr:hypothetical protein [Leptospira stimsonii]RHX83665.1 hypothetical protein DLM75_23705 [Leptospira stimsonii]